MKKRSKPFDEWPEVTAGLAIKLGSIAVHADELTSPDGHELDRVALRQGLDDPEVKAWLAEMAKLALVPLKRNQ